MRKNDGMLYTKGKGKLMFTPTNKQSVTINSATTVIAGGALSNLNLDKLVIPGTVKNLSAYALAYTNIKNITIENGVEVIGNHAFEKSTSDSPVVIPDSVKVFGNYSFNASKISDVVLPQGLTEIPMYCFRESKIKNIVIPNNVTVIRKQAFYYCTALKNISLPSSITSIEADAFDSPMSMKRDIYFAGSEKRWNRITFGKSAVPDTINTIHFGNEPDESDADEDLNAGADAANIVAVGYPLWAIFIAVIFCYIQH